MKNPLAFLLCIFTLLSVLSSCNFEEEISKPSGGEADLSSGELSELSSNVTSITEPRTISFGMVEDDDGLGQERYSQRIATRTSSYFENGEKIVVELFFGDLYSANQRLGHIPSYDTYGTNGYPMLRVCEALSVADFIVNENSSLTFNGESVYEIIFSAEDMKELDNTGDGTDYYKPTMEWHSETVEIDFSKLKMGDFGRILFCFGWFYTEESLNDDQSHSGQPAQNDFVCEIVLLEYYVSENGIGFSYRGWETAREEAEMIEGKTFPVEK